MLASDLVRGASTTSTHVSFCQLRRGRLVGVSELLERLLPLWTEPVDGRDDPEAAFGAARLGG